MMKSMLFWTTCLDLEVSELLENLMWKEHSIWLQKIISLLVSSKQHLTLRNLTSLTFAILLLEYIEVFISPAQPLLGLKFWEWEAGIECSVILPLVSLSSYQSY